MIGRCVCANRPITRSTGSDGKNKTQNDSDAEHVAFTVATASGFTSGLRRRIGLILARFVLYGVIKINNLKSGQGPTKPLLYR
jgi:hypothetical protein